MRVKRPNDPQVRAFWSQHVAAWMRSPFSQREYCERYGLSRTLLSKWRFWLSEDRARQTVQLTRTQLGMLLEGINWRMPERRWRPLRAG